MSGEALTVADAHGEVLDVRAASTERLARCISEINELRDRLREAEGAVAVEILERLDKLTQWTIRVDEDDVRYEIKAPSPEAGTESYPERELEGQLAKLVADGVVAPEAAEAALLRTVNVSFRVPWAADPEAIVAYLEEAVRIQVAGEDLHVEATFVHRKPVKAAINKMRKVPGTAERLDEAKRVSEPAARRVKVTATRRRT